MKTHLVTKFEAANFIYQLYLDAITDYRLADVHPDFYNLLCENARNPLRKL